MRKWSATPFDCIIFMDISSIAYRIIAGWTGLRASLEAMEKRNMPCRCRGIEPRFLGRSAHSLVLIPNALIIVRYVTGTPHAL